MEIFLPGVRGQSGVKVLIGIVKCDARLSPVTQAATENDIRFVSVSSRVAWEPMKYTVPSENGFQSRAS